MNINQKGITFLTAVIIIAFLLGVTGCTVVKQQENNKPVGEQSNAKLFIETMQKFFNENYQIADSSKEIAFPDPSGGFGPSIRKILKGYSFIYNASIVANYGSYMREKIGPTPAWLAGEMMMGYINDKIICIQSDATPGLDSPRYNPNILQRGPEIFCADLTPATVASDWKIFVDKTSGTTYKYPQTWQELSAEGCGSAFGPSASSYYITFCGPGYSGDAVGNDRLISKTDISVGGYSATRQEVVRFGNQYRIEITIKGIKYNAIISNKNVSSVGDWTLYFVIPKDSDKTDATKILDEILSTLKFTSPANSTTQSKPSITVLSPNGGESYQQGQQIPVKWTYSNLPGANTRSPELIENISIKVISQNGATCEVVSDIPVISTDYSINYPVGQGCYPLAPGTYRIFLKVGLPADVGVAEDSSNSYFTITK